jgi:putative ABC transport system permease protein
MDPARLTQALTRAVHESTRDQTLTEVKTLEQIKTRIDGSNRLQSMLLTVFAGIAVLLAAIGFYGVISYSVEQRTHEIGIRAALGASKGDLLRLILRGGMLMAGIGLAVGLGGVFGLTRLLANLLFGVGERGPDDDRRSLRACWRSSRLLACYIPARRATKVDPMIALR